MSYAESGEEDDEDEDAFDPSKGSRARGRALKRRKTSVESDDDVFVEASDSDIGVLDEGEFRSATTHTG